MGVDYFGNVVFINLHDRGTDDVLAHVGRLTHLKQLHRPGFAVTDAGLAHLGRLSDLQLLSLDDTQVTDAGLAHLKGLAGLKWLKLTRTRVTDPESQSFRSPCRICRLSVKTDRIDAKLAGGEALASDGVVVDHRRAQRHFGSGRAKLGLSRGSF